MSGGRPWTTGEVRRLHDMRARRVPTAAIAFELNRTKDAIWSFMYYSPAPPRPAVAKEPPPVRDCHWTPEELSTLREMADDGASYKDIVQATGRSPSAVRCKASNLGITFSNRGGNSIYRLDEEAKHFHRDAVEGSAKLLDAMLRMVA
jgi:hypothetical protein